MRTGNWQADRMMAHLGPEMLRWALVAGLAAVWWSMSAAGIASMFGGGQGLPQSGSLIAAGLITGGAIWSLDAARRGAGHRRGLLTTLHICLAVAIVAFSARAYGMVVEGSGTFASIGASAAGLALATAAQAFGIVLMTTRSDSGARRQHFTTDEADALHHIFETLGEGRLPSRRVFQDGLVWFEGGCRLVVPVTGPYEVARAPHTEDLVGLAHSLSAAGFIKPVRMLGGRSGAAELRRRRQGTTSLSPARERLVVYDISPMLVTHLLGSLQR